ncbi:efflux RND transporter periplasmic adaptor subunit [Methylobacterium planeticum]|uniref:Efflux RND transporter periplasmic adaptor subunit n=1 Tax=Methylobacterium planeticum TaxID=2615211 RepID=A0A6N6MSC7_9HYPH|nr:efflux RND transporter periplasmic adaptor subunit [Methylobacterium planeticum]KAB1074437.1 efflux RND transporter periplasmic adaptor subunit [Methylobacterium planeticum]
MNPALKVAGPAILALALGLPAGHARAETAPAPRASLAPSVSVVEASRREIVETVVVTGTLVPRDEILVTPEIEGCRITEVLVEEGARVARGQVLARLSRDLIDRQLAQQSALVDKARAAVPQAQSSIEQAEAAETEARLAFDRAKQLIQTGNATAVVMEGRTATLRQAEGKLAFARNGLVIARAEFAQAQAVRDELELRLARTEIRAPEGGIVSRRTARVGMAASASAEPLFRLIARGEIELEGEVIETRLPLLREGSPAWIEIGAGARVPGSVRAVYPEVDRATRLGKVRVRLEPDPRLRIGTFARGAVELARARGVTVPQASVLYGGPKRSSVLVVAGEVVEAREVRTGLSDDDDIEIRTGLAPGERVVARAGSFLRDGDRVRPVLVAAPAPAVAAAPAPHDTAEAGLP